MLRFLFGAVAGVGLSLGVGLGSGLAAAASSLAYDAPQAWTRVPAGSTMRLAEWKVGEHARVVVFYFGPGQGGSAEANVERWLGQFEQPDGSPTRDHAKQSETRVGDLTLTRVDVSGTYIAPVRPGASERRDDPDTRMIAVVVEGAGGPWFIRFLGPREEISSGEAAFDEFLSSLRVE